MNVRDRQKGCFYGLAVGDALGAAVEFRKPGDFAPVKCYRGFGPFNLQPGEWTDDTSMALALADSLRNGWNPLDQLEKYCQWYRTGKYSVNGRCFDIGGTTKAALQEFMQTKRPTAHFDQRTTSGNGSIMRLAPFAIAYHDQANISNLAGRCGATTHSSPECQDACVYLANLLADLINGMERKEALEHALTTVTDPRIRSVAGGSYTNEPPYIKGTGYVIKSLEAALWAFYKADSFEECVLKAVNLGDDSDTTGAVAGQMAGAYFGYSKIPESLIDGLAKKDMIDLYLNPLLKE
jgi:ADP-ribosyl-[dinitrogen reductase] hydrolase